MNWLLAKWRRRNGVDYKFTFQWIYLQKFSVSVSFSEAELDMSKDFHLHTFGHKLAFTVSYKIQLCTTGVLLILRGIKLTILAVAHCTWALWNRLEHTQKRDRIGWPEHPLALLQSSWVQPGIGGTTSWPRRVSGVVNGSRTRPGRSGPVFAPDDLWAPSSRGVWCTMTSS